jgi:hypothetical protein
MRAIIAQLYSRVDVVTVYFDAKPSTLHEGCGLQEFCCLLKLLQVQAAGAS